MASSSKEQELAIKIAGKVENSFKQAMNESESGLEKLASAAKKAAAVAAAAFAAVKIGDFISDAVSEYSEFEQSMANTSAIAGATSEEYDQLAEAARAAGKATTFTASEAADALGYMALAGWDVQTSTEALTPVLQLAEATQADLATTSDQVTDSMSAMGVGIDELSKYLDVIVATNNNANTTAADLMDAFIGCGGAARAAGMDYQETATALGILANNGIKGSEAGTALNSMLVRISTKDVAQNAFKELGVAVYDSSGAMRDMQDILVDTSKALEGMTDEQKNSYMSAIAGTNYYSQFGYLLDGVKEGADGAASAWDSLSASLDNSNGALEAMDATVTNTLQGAVARFQSAVSDLKITMVEDFGPYAIEIIDGVSESIPHITENFSKMIKSLPIDDFMSIVGQMSTGFFDFLDKVTSGESVIDALTEVAKNDFGIELPGSVQTLAEIIQNVWNIFKGITSWITTTATNVIQSLKNTIGEHEPQLQAIMELVKDLQEKFTSAFSSAGDSADGLISGGLSGLLGVILDIVGALANVIDKFVEWDGFIPTVTTLAAVIGGFKLAKTAVEVAKVTKALGLLTAAKAKDKAETLYLNALYKKDAILKAASTAKTIAQTAAVKAATIAQEAMNLVMSANPIMLVVIAIAALVAGLVVAYKKSEKFRNIVNGAFDAVKAKAEPVLNAIADFFKAAWDVIKETWDSFTPYFERIWSAIKTIFSVVAEFFGSIFTAAWNWIKSVWDSVSPYFAAAWGFIKAVFSVVASFLGGVFGKAWEIIKQVWDVVGQYFAMCWENIKLIFSAVGTVLGAYFKTAWEIIKAVWSVVVAFFQTIWNTIAGIFEVVAAVLSGDFSGAWEAIKGIFAGFASFFQTLWDAVKSIFGSVGSFFGTVFSTAWETIKGIFGNVQAFFKGVWDSIVSVFTSIGTAVADAISGAVKGAINAVLSGAAKIINGFINAINLAISVINAIPGVNISKLNQLEVPQLAEGAVVSDPTLAVIGEGKQDEAVVPLDTLWDKMKSTMMGILGASQSGISNALNSLTEKIGAMIEGSSQTPISTLVQTVSGGNDGPQLAAAGGANINYSPVYNFNGGTPTKDDLVEAERISQEEFNEMMEQWQRDNDRKSF